MKTRTIATCSSCGQPGHGADDPECRVPMPKTQIISNGRRCGKTASMMKSQLITVSLGSGVLRLKANCLAGLAVHRAPNAADGWKLTHIESGMAVAGFPNPSAALRALKAILPLADWTLSGEAIVKRFADPYYGEPMRNAIKSNGGSL